MSDVEFEEGNFRKRYVASPETPVLVRLLLKSRLVKNATQANYVLIGISIVALLLTVIVIKNGLN